jgi:ABC-2 type transport system permease protein
MMSIIMPLIYLVILGNSFQGKLHGLPLAVVNEDSGPYARRLMENLVAIEKGPRTFIMVNNGNEQEAMQGVREGRYKAALIIPADFSRNIARKSRPELGLFLDNTDSISSQAIAAAVNGAVSGIEGEYVNIRETPGRVYLRDVNLYRQVDYFQTLIPGVVIMSIFLGTLITGSFNLVMDRFLGVEESYLLTPLSKSHIVGGLVISGLGVTTIVALLIFSVSMLITGMFLIKGIGQIASILLVIVLTTLCLLSLMFVIIGRVNHPRIVGILSGFMNVILFFPSGAVYPVASFPPWLKSFAKVNPEAYAVHALKSILFKGESLGSVAGDIFFLLAFTAMTMTIAIISFKRTL